MVKIENCFYEYVDYDLYVSSYHIDKLIRTALNGSAAAFEKELRCVKQVIGLETVSEKSGNLMNILSQLIVFSDNPQKFKIMDKLLYLSSLNKWKDCSQFIQVCLFGSKELLDEMLREYCEYSLCIFSSLYYCDNGYDFLNNPVYWFLITGAYKKFPEGLRIFLEDVNYKNNITWAAVSAAVFKDYEFLRLLFSMGYVPDSMLFADLIYFPEKLVSMAKRLGKCFLSRECDFTSIPDIIESSLDEKEIIWLVNFLYGCRHSPSAVLPDIALLPKIKCLLLSDLLVVNIHNLISYQDKIFAPKVKIIVDINSSLPNDNFINSRLYYEVSSDVSQLDAATILKLFEKNAVFNIQIKDGEMPQTLKAMLDTDSARIYGAMIKNGLINSENLDIILEYLSAENLLNGIAAIQKKRKLIK